MPLLERACFFATWCFAGAFRSDTSWWLESAVYLAAGPLFGEENVPLAQC